MFALEPSFRNSGQLNYFPDHQQWTGPGTYVLDAIADAGFNPYGYYTNAAPYDRVEDIDSDSDVLRSVYTITKSHVANEFNVALSTSNLTSGVFFEGSDEGIVRADVWNSSELYFSIGSVLQEGYTSFVQNVTMELLDPVVAPPTSVSALGLDGEVSLSWTVMPGATQFDVYRDGGMIATVNTESYSDTSVVNGTTYSYTIVAKYSNGDSAQSAPAVATPQAIYTDEVVYATDFSGIALGDLASDTDWAPISGSSNNAFAVISDSGNKADTVSVQSYFTNTVGNAVYVDRLMQNEQDDVVEGYFDVVVSVTADGTADSDHTNQGVVGFGLTSSKTEWLNVTKDMMALLHLRVAHENNISVTFAYDGNDNDANRLAWLRWSELNWNPKPIGAAAQSWIGDPAAPRDLVTDPIRVSWKIRKTRDAGVYQAWASLSNLNTGVSNDGDPVEIEFETATKQPMYDSVASLFALGHYYKAHLDGRFSTLNATVNELSVTHSSGNLPEVVAPELTSVVSGDRFVSFSWDPVLDATGGYTIEIETPDSEVFVVADGITETAFTDSPRWNDVANTYTLTANFSSDLDPDTASTNFVAAPVGLVPIYDIAQFNGGDLTSTTPVITNSANWLTMDAMTTGFFVNGVDGYTGPTIYGTFKVPGAAPVAAVNISNGGARLHFGAGNSWSQGPYASKLAFLELSEITGESSFDPTDSQLYIRADWGSWSLGNAGAINGVRVAIRNGTTWYASAYNEVTNPGGEYHSLLVADVANSDWYELTVPAATTGAEISLGSTAIPGSTFTDVNAIGWYSKGFWSCTVYELEIQGSGALGSYDYWSLNQGLVSTNSAPNLDPDGDDVTNEKEYAFGGDPLVADTAILPAMDMAVMVEPGTGDEFFTYTYMKQRDPQSGISYIVNSSENLMLDWEVNSYLTEEVIVDYYWTAVTNFIPLDANQTFLKVEVE